MLLYSQTRRFYSVHRAIYNHAQDIALKTTITIQTRRLLVSRLCLTKKFDKHLKKRQNDIISSTMIKFFLNKIRLLQKLPEESCFFTRIPFRIRQCLL